MGRGDNGNGWHRLDLLLAEVRELTRKNEELEQDYADAVAANLRLALWMKDQGIEIPKTEDLVRAFPKKRLEYLWRRNR